MELELALEWIETGRLLKWFGLSMWAIGIHQVMVSPRQEDRLKGLYGFTAFGFALTWMAGWAMMKALGYPARPRGSESMLFGLISLGGSFLRAFSSSRGQVYNAILSIGFTLSIASMVVRSGNDRSMGIALALSLFVGGLGAWILPSRSESHESESTAKWVARGFTWIARVEGATVLVLFCLSPAKKLLEFNLDGGTGPIGWTLGVFVILYVVSLTFTSRALNWSWKRTCISGFASFLPFGTFVFERKVFRNGIEP